MMKKYIFVVLTLFAVPALADYSKVISDSPNIMHVEVEQTYVLGDGDTKVDARNIAMQQAKIKAAELAGSYVQAEMSIKDDKIQGKTIKSISQAMMSSTIKSEKWTVNNAQQLSLVLVLSADLDKKSFKEKLGIIKNDESSKKYLEDIESENARLQQELASVNTQLYKAKQAIMEGSITSKPSQILLNRRDEIFHQLGTNETKMKKIFSQENLVQIAISDMNEYEAGLNDIKVNIYDYIKNNTTVTISKPVFHPNKDGTFNVEIPVSWSISPKSILQVINKYFEYERKSRYEISDCKNGSNYLEIKNDDSKCIVLQASRYKTASTKALFEYMRSHSIRLNVEVGNMLFQIPVMINSPEMKIQIYANNKFMKHTLPIEIKSLSKENLSTISLIQAKLEIL